MPKQPHANVALIGAMDEEVCALTRHLKGCQKHEQMHCVYYTGQLHDKEVVVFQSGLGKVNAALAAAFVIAHFSPEYIINIGSAGGFDDNLHIGDIVISSSAFYHDVDVTLLQCAYGQIPGMPVTFAADRKLIELAGQAVTMATNLKSVEGAIGSGDAFISSPQSIALIRQRFPNMIAVDMEAAAIAHTCYLYSIPFVVIRAISDVVGHSDNHVDFFTFLQQAAHNSAQAVELMVASL